MKILSFQPIQGFNFEVTEQIADNEIKLDFEVMRETEWSNKVDTVKNATKEYIFDGYKYIYSVMGKEFPISTSLSVNLLSPESNSSHGMQGALMRVASKSVLESLEDKFENIKVRGRAINSEQRKDLEQSLFVHELIHNLTDDEDFPIFLELIYMIEKGNYWRLNQLKDFVESGTFDEKENLPHKKGIEKIASYLHYDNTTKLLDNMGKRPLDELKTVFKEELEKYCKQEGVI